MPACSSTKQTAPPSRRCIRRSTPVRRLFYRPGGLRKFYLTFDEGYENGYTPQILDVLKEKNVSAVFFVTLPFVKSSPDLVRR